MAAKSSPQHFYMVAALITYVREDVPDTPRQRHMNAVMTQPRKAVTASAINNARIAMLQRLTDESGVPSDGVRDIVFLGFSYLGHMAPEDFHDMQGPAPGAVKH